MKNEQTKAKKKACPVKLRFNTLKDGTRRIFLASYIIDLATGEANKTGRYTYKTLGLVLVEEKTAADKRANKQTMQLAQATAQQIADKYNRQRLGVRVSHSSPASFIDYVSMIEHRTRADGGTGTAGSWHKLILRLSRNLVGISIQVCNTEQKKLPVNNAPEVSPEQFDFGIERFRQSV